MLISNWLSCILLVDVMALLLPGKSDAGCVCKEKGIDYCAGSTGRVVVRPKHRYSDGSSDIDVKPIGDKCWCTKKMIEPAVLPKISEKKKTCSCKKSSSSCTCGNSCSCGKSSHSTSSSYDAVSSIFASGGTSRTYMGPQASYVKSTARNDDSLPADPISISLAIQAGKAIEVPEAKLSYGFVQKPINSLPKVYISSVEEANLYALNNDVITLKKLKSNNKKVENEYPDMDDEEIISSDGSNVSDDDDDQPRLTYKQLGYVAEQYKNPTFEEVEPSYDSASSSSSKSEPSVVSGRVSVDCGYRPGRISTMRRSKQISYN